MRTVARAEVKAMDVVAEVSAYMDREDFGAGGANQRISGRLGKIVWIGCDRGLWKQAI